MDDTNLSELFSKARQGDEEAIAWVLRRYEAEVRLVVRSRLPRVLRSRFDSMDFVQAVWTSVLTKPGEDLRFESPRHLMGYLAGVAKNKVYEEHRRQSTRKYNIKLNQPLYINKGGREVPRELAAADPSPSATLQADDRLERMLKGRSSFVREVVELRKNLMTYEEIGERLGLHESAVRKVVTELKRREERG